MTFRDLEYLVALAEEKHFGRAATRCHTSQSTLSLQLQKLESELATQLVERTSRRVLLTAAGESVVDRAREILHLRRGIFDLAGPGSSALPPRLRLGMIPTIAPYRLGPVLATLAAASPATEVLVVEEVTRSLEERVAGGDLDAAILATPVEDSLLDEVSLEIDELLLVLAETHPLAHRDTLDASDLAEEPLLLLKDGHCLRDQTLAFCLAQAGPTQHHSLATGIETLKSLVRAGKGVALVPAMATPADRAEPGLCYRHLKPAPSRRLRLVTRKTSRLGTILAEIFRKSENE